MPKEPIRTPHENRPGNEDLVVNTPPDGGEDVVDRPTGALRWSENAMRMIRCSNRRSPAIRYKKTLCTGRA